MIANLRTWFSLWILGILPACGIPPHPKDPDDVILDPFEKVNRCVFAFNRVLDQCIVFPYLHVYHALLPPPFLKRVSCVLENLNAPTSIANSILQASFEKTCVHFWRFVFNTTLGIGGIFDVASSFGLNAAPETFTETFKRVLGMPPGFYFVLPFVGPATARSLMDMAADYYLISVNYPFWINTVTYGLEYSTLRLTYRDIQKQIYETSTDPYKVMRHMYYEAYDDLPKTENLKKKSLQNHEKSPTEEIPEVLQGI